MTRLWFCQAGGGGDSSTIIEVGVLERASQKGVEIFTRSILFKSSQIDEVRIGYKSSYYLPMGFDYDEDGMKIAAGNWFFRKLQTLLNRMEDKNKLMEGHY